MIRPAIAATVLAAAAVVAPLTIAGEASAAVPGRVTCVRGPCEPLPIVVKTTAPRNYRGWTCYHLAYHTWACVYPRSRRH